MKYIAFLTKKRINQTLKKELPIKIIKNSIMDDNKIKSFWEHYKKFIHSTELKDSDFVSPWWAGKHSSLDRRIISKLAEDGLIRKNIDGDNKKISMPDVRLVEKFLNYFESAKNIEIIKETDITGQKKYLLTDFQASSAGKTIPEHKMELMLKMFIDLFSNFYEITPKIGLDIPKTLQIKNPQE